MPIVPLGSRTLLVRQQTGIGRGPVVILYQRSDSRLWAGQPNPPVLAIPSEIVVSDSYTMSVGLWRATIDNALVEEISAQLVDGSIDMNLDRDVKLAATFVIRDPGNIVPYTDFLAPFIRLDYDDGRPDVYQQLGLYATKVAPGSYNINDSVATFEGADLTSVMATAYLTDTINRAAGQNYVTAGIVPLFTNLGITRYNLPATAETFPVIQTYPIGMSYLERANLVCDQLGWYHLGMDLDGRISTPGAPQALASMEPWRVLTDTDIIGNIDVQPTGQEIANVVIVINDDGAAAPLYSVATNSDPSSPTSTVSIGRSIMRKVVVSGSTTQAALDALAARLLAESRTFYRTAKLTLLHDPIALVMHQVVQLNLTGKQAGLSGKWWIRTASFGLTPDKPLVIECNQVTDTLNQAVI